MINDLFKKEVEILNELQFHSKIFNVKYRWTVIVGKESYDIKSLSDGSAFGPADFYILSAGEEAPILYFDKLLNKIEYINIHGWALGPRLPKQYNKGAKYYYVINPEGETNIVELTHWPLYLYRRFLEYIRNHY